MTTRNTPPSQSAGAGPVRIALLQHNCGTDPAQNIEKAIGLTREAASHGAQIVATQELFASQYFPQIEDAKRYGLAETIPGPTTQRLCGLAGELGIYITASLFEKRAQGVYHNTSVLISPDGGGRIAGTYRKMHIPDDPNFYEKFYFTPGDAPGNVPGNAVGGDSGTHPGWQAIQTPHANVGMLICWDQWFPEAARLTALGGAQIIFYPTAIGWASNETPDERKRQLDTWQTVQRSHAITNGVFVVAINRVGTEGDLQFWGSSFVADPGGNVIAKADPQQEQIIYADCDLSLIDEYRQAWPFLRDRRVDAYRGLTQRYL